MTKLEMANRNKQSDDTPAVDARPRQRLVALAVGLALLLGGLAGWTLGNTTREDTGVVLAGEGELTERQEAMIDFLRDYIEAWRQSDVETLESMWVTDGVFESLGRTVRISDGSFADYVRFRSWESKGIFEPMLVKGSLLVGFHETDGSTFMNTMRFTSHGELLLIRHVATR